MRSTPETTQPVTASADPSEPGPTSRCVAYLASELGALSGTFVYREIQQLRKEGVTVLCFGTRRPEETVRSTEADDIVSETTYLYDASPAELLREAATFALRHPGPASLALRTAASDSVGNDLPSRGERAKALWHALVGLALARRLEGTDVQHVHSHFAHVPTSIAMYASLAMSLPFSFTGHANDLFERATLLKQKLQRCAFSSCISHYNQEFLQSTGGALARLPIVRCGIDVSQFEFRERELTQQPRVLFVGRLVEKKGAEVLLRALAQLEREGVVCHADIVGNGPLLESLQQLAHNWGLDSSVRFHGAQPQEAVRGMLDTASLFVLPCVVTGSGDRDGIPVALMEAMATGVPVVSTRISGIPELIESGVSGLLAEPNDVAGLATAMKTLLTDAGKRAQLAANARKRIEEEFSLAVNARRLVKLMFEPSEDARSNSTVHQRLQSL